MKHIHLLFIILLLSNYSLVAQFKIGNIGNDGAWCWFSDPRAIMVDDDNLITGWVKSNGNIEAAILNLTSLETETSELYYHLEVDDHDNPAFTLTSDGQVLAMYTRHGKKDLFINTLPNFKVKFRFSEPKLIHPIDDAELREFPRATITYANPYRLKEENGKIYCFGRWTGFKPNVMWSTDNGQTWSKSKVFITNYPFDQNNRPYVKYFSDGKSKIHIVFTDGHPRDEPTNSVYYVYYENGVFYNASGEKISTLDQVPFEPKDSSIVYTSNAQSGRAWIADISQDELGNPVILYTKSPTENNHEYWYSRYTGNTWIDYKICDSGKWFPQTPEGQKEREPHYFGGLAVHPDNANIIYLSRQINGIFEIERWTTDDFGASWESESITKDSQYDNVRPYIPHGLKSSDKEVVLWMENQSYVHYTNYKTVIKYAIKVQ